MSRNHELGSDSDDDVVNDMIRNYLPLRTPVQYQYSTRWAPMSMKLYSSVVSQLVSNS